VSTRRCHGARPARHEEDGAGSCACAITTSRSGSRTVCRQRAVMSRIPQSTQKVRPCRRATACREPSQSVAGSSAFTTPPHSGQWLTGASRRRWFMFSQAGLERCTVTSTRPAPARSTGAGNPRPPRSVSQFSKLSSLLVPSRARTSLVATCTSEKPTAKDDAAESRTDTGTGLSYVESVATASVPPGGFRADAAAPEEPPVHALVARASREIASTWPGMPPKCMAEQLG
jgi:hypothetical protein